MITNPYLDTLLKEVPIEQSIRGSIQFKSYDYHGFDGNHTEYRYKYVRRFAWAIPDNQALHEISQFTSCVCEIGAGTGYWAYMLSQCKVSVVAYDLYVPGRDNNQYGHKQTYFDVQPGDVLSINHHHNRALMLCWPPYQNTMCEAILELFHGEKVIYIGEGEGGCTGTDKFHEMLDTGFKLVEIIDIPQWDGIHDSVYLYER